MTSSSDSTEIADDSSEESVLSWHTASSDSHLFHAAFAVVMSEHALEGNRAADTPASRINGTIYDRVIWEAYWTRKLTDSGFEQTIRMTRQSFVKLVDILRASLQVDMRMGELRGGGVQPEVAVYATIRYLSGGSSSDIMDNMGIARSTFYAVIQKTMKAIIACPALDIVFPTTLADCHRLSGEFQKISPNDSIINCVGAVDGYLMSIDVPNKEEAGNVTSFFSGHYQRYGVNIQACCDANSRFTYFEMAGPGSANDRFAIKEKNRMGTSLHEMIEALPPGYVVIGDPAYQCTEHLVALFYGSQRHNLLNNNFNYAGSVCRIRIEMAFGLMNTKWCILNRPLKQPLRHVKYIAYSIARLHNFCITERLQQEDSEWDIFIPHTPSIPNEQVLGVDQGPEFPAVLEGEDNLYAIQSVSKIRLSMAREVRRCNVRRPVSSVLHPDRVAEI